MKMSCIFCSEIEFSSKLVGQRCDPSNGFSEKIMPPTSNTSSQLWMVPKRYVEWLKDDHSKRHMHYVYMFLELYTEKQTRTSLSQYGSSGNDYLSA